MQVERERFLGQENSGISVDVASRDANAPTLSHLSGCHDDRQRCFFASNMLVLEMLE